MEYKSPKKLLLIVEDEEPMMQALTETFVSNGFRVDKAKNGVEGLGLALSDHPDLIILDLLMPEMDGMTMMSKLRVDSWGNKVPIIILTNVNPETNNMLQSIIKSQPAYYLIKSNVKLADILDKAKGILQTPV